MAHAQGPITTTAGADPSRCPRHPVQNSRSDCERPRRPIVNPGIEGSSPDYWIRSNTLKIGMYRAMIMPPITTPMQAIIRGSIREVSASVVASTSWS